MFDYKNNIQNHIPKYGRRKTKTEVSKSDKDTLVHKISDEFLVFELVVTLQSILTCKVLLKEYVYGCVCV